MQHIEKNGNKRGVKFDLLLTYLLGVIVSSLPLFSNWDFVVIMDYFGTLVPAATLGGCDWSGIMERVRYYGFGYYWIYAGIFKLTDDPYVIWISILVITHLLLGIVPIIIFYILKNYFEIRKRWLIILLSVIGSLLTIGYGLANTIPLTVVMWVCILLVLKCYETRNNKKENRKLSIGLSLALAYLLTIHERGLAFWIGIIVGIILFYFIFEEKVISIRWFGSILLCGFGLQRIIRNLILQEVWISEAGEYIPNTSVVTDKMFTVLDSFSTIKTAVDIVLSNLYKLTIETFGTAIIAVVIALYCIIKKICKSNKYINHFDLSLEDCKKEILVILISGSTFIVIVCALAAQESISVLKAYFTNEGTDVYKILFYYRYYQQVAGMILISVFSICVKKRAELLGLFKYSILILLLVFVYLCFIVFPHIAETVYFGSKIAYSPLFTRFLNTVDIVHNMVNIIISLSLTTVLIYVFLRKKKSWKIILCIIYVMIGWNALTRSYLSSLPNITASKAGATYEFLKEIDELDVDNTIIYVNTKNYDSIYTFQFFLNRYKIEYGLPDVNIDDAIVISDEYISFENQMFDYCYLELDNNEILYVKGEKYKQILENSGVLFVEMSEMVE